MPIINRVALFGSGRIGRILFAGTAALSVAETKQEESVFDSDMLLKILEPADYTSLVKAYKKVQRQYYPEKDILNKRSKEWLL